MTFCVYSQSLFALLFLQSAGMYMDTDEIIVMIRV